MNYFKRFLKYAIPYKWTGIFGIIFNIFYAFFTTLSYIILMPTLNVLFEETEKVYTKPELTSFSGQKIKAYFNDLLNYYVTYNNENFGAEKTLMYIIVIVVFVFLLKNIFGYLGQVCLAFLKNDVLKDLRIIYYNKISNLSIPYFSDQNKGDIISRATTDLNNINNTYLTLVIIFIREPLNIIFTLCAMLITSLELSIFIFVFIPLAGLLISAISKKIKKQSGEIFYKNGVFLGLIEESISGLKIIKNYTAEALFAKKFNDQTVEIKNLSNKLSIRESIASPLSEFLGILTIGSILWYGGKMVLIDQSLASGTFVGFMAAAYNILSPAKAIAKANNNVKIGDASAKRFFEVLDTEDSIKEVSDPLEIDAFKNEIEFKNIYFKYNDQYVLENFSLKIPKGKTVAFVGQSGSGKSTLANLITRFYDVEKGEILIDGINIKNISKKSLRNLMGVVAQDPVLFNDSVKNNILLGNINASFNDVQEAAKAANAHDFIENLSEKYETNVGERGDELSGGQKQRVSIARAILKNAPIMILDEATSALDSESEKFVQNELDIIMKNRTSMVIAHRLSTIQNSDLIIVMRDGKIIEQGKHTELLDKNGDYAKLVAMQTI